MKSDIFHSCGHSWVFQICWYIECSTLTSSSFRILNSSAGVPSLPLALFVEMLPKAPMTSQSILSGSDNHCGYQVIKILFVQFFSAFCHLFLASSASVRSLLFLSFIERIFAWSVPLASPIFLKRSLVFPILFFPPFLYSVQFRRSSLLSLLFSGTLDSVGCIAPFLLCPLLPFFSQLCVRPPQAATSPSCLSFLGDYLVSTSYAMLWTSVHSSSVTPSTTPNPLNPFLTSIV